MDGLEVKRLWLFLLMAILPVASEAAPPALRLKATCEGDRNCLEMVLYHAQTLKSPSGGFTNELVTRIIPLEEEGLTDYELSVVARLNGGKASNFRLLARAFDSGIDCTGFGQISVAVKGYSPEDNPLLVTDAGELEIIKAPKLEVGCKDCLELFDRHSKQLVENYTTPASDLTMLGLKLESFHYNELGESFVRKGKSCIRLGNRVRFEAVANERCRSKSQLVGHYGRSAHGLNLAPGEFLYEMPGSDHLMRITSIACT